MKKRVLKIWSWNPHACTFRQLFAEDVNLHWVHNNLVAYKYIHQDRGTLWDRHCWTGPESRCSVKCNSVLTEDCLSLQCTQMIGNWYLLTRRSSSFASTSPEMSIADLAYRTMSSWIKHFYSFIHSLTHFLIFSKLR